MTYKPKKRNGEDLHLYYTNTKMVSNKKMVRNRINE